MDADAVPKPEATPEPSPQPPQVPPGPIRIDSLSSLAELHPDGLKAPRPKPEPITLNWLQWDKSVEMVVETKYSEEDHWTLGIRLMATIEDAKTATYDDKGKETFSNENAPLLMLCREFVQKPTWLKNPDGLAKLRKIAPPEVLGMLQRKLMLFGGFDADFFGDYQQFVNPAYRMLVSASRSALASSQAPSTESPTTASSPGTSSTSNGVEKNGSTASATTSGSSSPTPPTVDGALGSAPRPTPSSVTS